MLTLVGWLEAATMDIIIIDDEFSTVARLAILMRIVRNPWTRLR